MALAAIWDVGSKIFALARRVEELLALQSKMTASLDIIEQRLCAVEDRLLRIEAEGPHLMNEARGAAGAAATAMSSAALNDVVTRLTRVEVKLEGLDAGSPTRRRIAGPN